MKPFIRLATLLLLVGFPLAGRVLQRLRPIDVVYPFRAAVTVDRLKERGTLRLAVEKNTLSYFIHRGVARGFEYDLLGEFASELGVDVLPRVVASAGEAADMLRSGVADAAVLPWSREPKVEGGVRLDPYIRERWTHVADHDFPQTGAIFVREDSPALVHALNGYLARTAANGVGKELWERYFVYSADLGIVRDRGRVVGRDRRISRYDHLIAKHAQQAGFDWRLVAAVIFRESRFDPHAVSRRGARGLMQVMPGTATDVGVPNARSAEASIQAGVAYLRRLSETFQESGGDDHLAIVLAAYLLGPGHVSDAQQIAHSLDLHTNLWWGGLKHVLPLLEKPAFYNHTKFGFASGHHAIRYVEQIFKRYNLYRRHADEQPVESAKTSRKDEGSA